MHFIEKKTQRHKQDHKTKQHNPLSANMSTTVEIEFDCDDSESDESSSWPPWQTMSVEEAWDKVSKHLNVALLDERGTHTTVKKFAEYGDHLPGIPWDEFPMEYVWNVYEERASQLEGEEDTGVTPLPRFHYGYLISRTEIYKHGSAVLEAPPEEIPMNPFQLLLLDINKEIRKVQRRETGPDDVVFRGGFAGIEVDQGETITEDERSRICSIINTNIPSTVWCTEEQRLMVEAACCKVFRHWRGSRRDPRV